MVRKECYRLTHPRRKFLATPLAGRQLKCSVAHAKRSFYRSTSAIFGKIGRIASEDELIDCKCMPILLYGLECFSVAKHDVRSLDFAVKRFSMKLFRSTTINVIDECRLFFNFMLPSEKKLKKRRISFESKVLNCNSLLYYFNMSKIMLILSVFSIHRAWRKVMAAYRRVYDSRHLQADCREPRSAPEPYAR